MDSNNNPSDADNQQEIDPIKDRDGWQIKVRDILMTGDRVESNIFRPECSEFVSRYTDLCCETLDPLEAANGFKVLYRDLIDANFDGSRSSETTRDAS